MSTLRRYTDIASLLDIINTSSITMLSPSNWVDQNDRYGMERYKSYRNVKTLLAICFTEADETFHHWNVFAAGSNGVCISFEKDALVQSIIKNPGIRHKAVEYADNINAYFKSYGPEELPFLKREGYNDEKEYRFIYEENEQYLTSSKFCIDLSSIEEVTFSPGMPEELFYTISSVLHQLPQLNENPIQMKHSSIVNDYMWQIMVDYIVDPSTFPEDLKVNNL